ncbi:MAG: PQQ-binding-like beta-propeller repeat protein, partial [Thermoguttaceae bacterium]
LVTDDLLIISAGGPSGRSLIAYNRETGDVVWNAGSDQSAYASPVLATLAGVPQILIVNQDYLVSHRLADGEQLWRNPWPGGSNSNASSSQPVVLPGDRVFISKGYRIGSSLLAIRKDDADQFEVEPLWDPPVRAHMKTKFTNVVIRDGYVYGLDEGILECIELETGERMWKRGRYGHGQIILVGDQILVSTETGGVVLVEASPDSHRELTRFQAIEGKTWNNPALAGRYLLVRNHREAACYELPLAED